MNTGQTLLIQGFKTLLQVHGVTLTLPNGGTAKAVLNSDSPVSPEALLGDDPREVINIEFLKPAPEIEAQDVLTTEDGTELQITGRDDNPALPIAKFKAVKVV